MSVQRLHDANARGVERFDEGALLKEIEDIQVRVAHVVRNTCWPLIEQPYPSYPLYPYHYDPQIPPIP